MKSAALRFLLLNLLTFSYGFSAFSSPVIREHSYSTRLFISEHDDSLVVENRRETASDSTSGTKRVSILLCPAQFCVPADYKCFFDTIKTISDNDTNAVEIGTCRVAPLPRTEWIKVAKQLPTKNFFDATLEPNETLQWYFDAIEEGLMDIFAEEGDDAEICIIGHSIGGWVARAYLGGLSQSSKAVHGLIIDNCRSFVTLGTPHSSPASALVDQTRGLLKRVEVTKSCSAESLQRSGIQVTCVGSRAIEGKIPFSNVEELVALTSYVPLSGKFGANGDGIIPEELAFMEEPAKRIVLEKCSVTNNAVRHAHVLPTPWNLWDGYAPSIALPDDFCWYGSDGVVEQWIEAI
jgi:hypothetical protein